MFYRPWHRFPREYGPGIGRRTFELMSALNDFVRLNSTRDRAVYKPLVHEVCIILLKGSFYDKVNITSSPTQRYNCWNTTFISRLLGAI